MHRVLARGRLSHNAASSFLVVRLRLRLWTRGAGGSPSSSSSSHLATRNNDIFHTFPAGGAAAVGGAVRALPSHEFFALEHCVARLVLALEGLDAMQDVTYLAEASKLPAY